MPLIAQNVTDRVILGLMTFGKQLALAVKLSLMGVQARMKPLVLV
jgi:hypothetical protein